MLPWSKYSLFQGIFILKLSFQKVLGIIIDKTLYIDFNKRLHRGNLLNIERNLLNVGINLLNLGINLLNTSTCEAFKIDYDYSI